MYIERLTLLPVKSLQSFVSDTEHPESVSEVNDAALNEKAYLVKTLNSLGVFFFALNNGNPSFSRSTTKSKSNR